jgi:hypothetical protein
MGDRHVSMIINAPPERVFKLYTDPRRAREWLPGVREVRATGPPDQPGSRAVFAYRWPFTMTAEVLGAEPPHLRIQRLKELLGLVTCTTTARFRPVEGATELGLEMDYRVAGGPSAASSTLGSGTRWSPPSARTSPGSRRWPRSKLDSAGSDAREVA